VLKINARLTVAFLTAIAVSGGTARAQEDYEVLKTFLNTEATVATGLVRANDGNFYGSTTQGVYRLTPDGAFTLIRDRGARAAGLIQASDGNLYFRVPTAILRMSLDGATSVVHAFGPGEGGIGALIEADDGLFYGLQGTVPSTDPPSARLVSMTPAGVINTFPSASTLVGVGSSRFATGTDGFFYVGLPRGGIGIGSIVRLSRNGQATTLHVFHEDAGGSDLTGVVMASDGKLYGTTRRNGAHGFGTIFRLELDGQFTTLYSFTGLEPGGDGLNYPSELIEGSDGNLYGTGDYGIFRFTKAGALALLHTTTLTYPGWAANDRYGWRAVGVLAEGPGGDLYGVTRFGAAGNRGGLFRLEHDRSACADDVRPVWRDFDGGTLYLLGALKNETRAVWGAWLVTAQEIKRLWLTVVPPVTPTFVFELPMPQPDVGTIGVYTVVLTSDGHSCSDWSTTNTGGSGPSSEDLKRMLDRSLALDNESIR